MIESNPALRLRVKIEIGMPILFRVGESIYRGGADKERYCEYLITLHGIVRASVPLMEKAVEVAERRHPNDAVASGVANYLRKHIPEEIGHDEWLLEDLDVLGVDRKTVIDRIPSPFVASLVGAQYYWIEHYHPVSLLGYIAVMEGYPPAIDNIQSLAEQTTLPQEAFRTLRQHALIDPHHRDALDYELNRLPLTRDHEVLLGMSALHTISCATDALEVVAETILSGNI